MQGNHQYQANLFPLRAPEWEVRDPEYVEADGSQFMRSHTMQPLFRALFVVLTDYLGGAYMRCLNDVANLEVKLVLTGFTDGLSAPISFDSIGYSDPRYVPKSGMINTTMQIAFDFITSLEKREAEASTLSKKGITPTNADCVEYARELFGALLPSIHEMQT